MGILRVLYIYFIVFYIFYYFLLLLLVLISGLPERTLGLPSVRLSVRLSVRPHSQESNYVARGTIGNCSFSLMSFIS
jgi:hypothetical protein